MGSNISLTYKMVEPNTKVYYSSAKFREVQIYNLIHNEPLTDFPTSSCFFVTESYESSLLYSNVIRQPQIFYQNSKNYPKSLNHDVTHTYLVKDRQTTIQLNDPKTLHYILFEDSSSPFHLNKANENLLSVDIFSARGPKGWPSLKAYEYKYNTLINPGSGFALILVATNYMNYELYGDDISRLSFYELDYTIIKLLKDYLIKVNSNIQGWCQPAEKFFHQEYMFFDPAESLVPNYQDPKSWFQKIYLPTSYPKVKESFLKLMKIGENRLNILKKTYENDLSYLKSEALKLNSKETDSMLQANIELHQEIIHKEENLYKENTLTYLVPYLSDLYKLKSKYNELQKIFFIDNDVKCHLEINCTEPFGFEKCQQSLKSLVDQMRLYTITQNMHHKGTTVADHAIWVARTIHKWFQYEKHPWTEHIWKEFQNITLLASFIHDIGKIGDLDFHSLQTIGVKPDHPFKGYEYVLSKLLFKVISNEEQVSHHKLLDYIGCTFNKVDVIVIALVIALHHFFGQLLMTVDQIPLTNLYTTKLVDLPFNLNKDHYKLCPKLNLQLLATLNNLNFKQILFLHQILRYLKEVDHKDIFIKSKANLIQLVHILFAVSAADTYGAFPVDLPKGQVDGTEILKPEFLYEKTSNPEISVIIDRPFYKYLYHTLGLQQKYNFLLFISKVVNFSVFLNAWDNFNKFIGYLERCLNNFMTEEIFPYPYNLLRQDSIEIFKDDLFNLLETGYIKEQANVNQTLNPALNLELTCDISEDDTFILEDSMDTLDIIQDFKSYPIDYNQHTQRLNDNLTLEFKDKILKVIQYRNFRITLEKYEIDTLSLYPDIKITLNNYASVSLRYVQSQVFSVRNVKYYKINYLSDLLQILLIFTRATLIYEEPLSDNVDLINLLTMYEFNLTQIPPIRNIKPILVGTVNHEIITITLHVHYNSLEVIHNNSIDNLIRFGFFEIDVIQGNQVTLNTSIANFTDNEILNHKTFPFKISQSIISSDDLINIIMSYVQGPNSTLKMFIFTKDGTWTLSPTVNFQNALITIRELTEHSIINKIISEIKLWYNNQVQRSINNYTFLDVINNLSGKDIKLQKFQIGTLFKVTFVPWDIILSNEQVYSHLEYKIDTDHNIGPVLTPTFKINLLLKLLFQTP